MSELFSNNNDDFKYISNTDPAYRGSGFTFDTNTGQSRYKLPGNKTILHDGPFGVVGTSSRPYSKSERNPKSKKGGYQTFERDGHLLYQDDQGVTYNYYTDTPQVFRTQDANINPRTGLPYSESPGKSGTRPVDTMLDEVPDFQLVPENAWTQIDAKTLGMTPQNAIALQEYSQQAFKSGDAIYGKAEAPEIPEAPEATGTDTGSGSREAPAPTKKPERVKRTAADVVDSFKSTGTIQSSRLSDALRGAQIGIIQNRMDAGENFGFKSTPTTPQTTSDPQNPQDGLSTIADLNDQSRAIDFPQYNPEQFKTDFMNSKLGSLLTDINKPGLRDVDFDEYK